MKSSSVESGTGSIRPCVLSFNMRVRGLIIFPQPLWIARRATYRPWALRYDVPCGTITRTNLARTPHSTQTIRTSERARSTLHDLATPMYALRTAHNMHSCFVLFSRGRQQTNSFFSLSSRYELNNAGSQVVPAGVFSLSPSDKSAHGQPDEQRATRGTCVSCRLRSSHAR